MAEKFSRLRIWNSALPLLSRFSFCAAATLTLLGRLEEMDVDKAVEFIESCMNFDGGFGSKKSSESHAGQESLGMEVGEGIDFAKLRGYAATFTF